MIHLCTFGKPMQYIPNNAIESIILIVIASKYGIFTIIKTLHYQQVFLLLCHLSSITRKIKGN